MKTAAAVAAGAGALALSVLGFAGRGPRSAALDAGAAAAIPVLHEGRVKPLDTVARATLLTLRSKQTVPVAGRTAPALEWLLAAAVHPVVSDAEPAFVIDDPDVLGLLGLERKSRYWSYNDILPGLEELQIQAARAEAIESAKRSRFEAAAWNLWRRVNLYRRLKNTVQPEDARGFSSEISEFERVVPAGVRAVLAHQTGRGFDEAALSALAVHFERYRFLDRAALFFPVPPDEAHPEWRSIGSALLDGMREGELHPAVKDWAALAGAWAAGDAAAFQRAAGALSARSMAAAPAETSKARHEAAYNRLQVFTAGMALYVLALVLAGAHWLSGRAAVRTLAFWTAAAALAVHTGGLVARMYLEGRPPVTNLYSSAVFVGWVAVCAGLVLERLSRQAIGTAVSAVLGFSTLIIAHHLASTGDTMEVMRAVLDSNFWLGTHVVMITLGYGATFLAGTVAHVWILGRLLTRSIDEKATRDLARMTYGVVCFSVFASFVGTVLGGIWADQSWGRFWGWDPKENGALLIVLWDAVILHSRWGGFARERGIMAMAVFGNIVTAMSWFGVNMLGIGLHSYGFMDKAFLWLALFTVLQLGVVGLAYLPDRKELETRWKGSPA